MLLAREGGALRKAGEAASGLSDSAGPVWEGPMSVRAEWMRWEGGNPGGKPARSIARDGWAEYAGDSVAVAEAVGAAEALAGTGAVAGSGSLCRREPQGSWMPVTKEGEICRETTPLRGGEDDARPVWCDSKSSARSR